MGFGLGLNPTTPNVSARQSLHLICPLASRSHRNQLWNISIRPLIHSLIHSVGAPHLASTAIFEHDARYLRRESWLSFPSLRLEICSLRIKSPRPPSTPFIKFTISSTIDTVLMADRSLLAGGIPPWSNKLSLVFPFLSSCSTTQRVLTNVSSTSPPARPMRAPDSRPSISVSPAATSAAYSTYAVIFHVSIEPRL